MEIEDLNPDTLKEIITEDCVEIVGALHLLGSADFEAEITFNGKTYIISIDVEDVEDARIVH